MAVRKIRNSWWVDFWSGHVRYRKRSPENSRNGALAYEALLRQKLARGQSIDTDVAQLRQSFEEFARTWFEQYVLSNSKHSDQRTKHYILKSSLIPFFGKLPVPRITAYHIEQFKARKITEGVTNKTIKNHLAILNRCLGSAYEWLALEGSPPKIKWPKCAPTQADHLSPDECELLLEHTNGVVREMILTALRTGMRQGELKGLQWSSIDWENRSVAVRHSRDDRTKMLLPPKSNRERHIPMDVDVYEALFKRKRATGYVFLDEDRRPFEYHRIERRLTKACGDAGIRRIGWHTLRHTFASHLAMKGVPMTAVQQLMGHSNITTTMRYSHLAPSALRTAIDMLNPKKTQHADLGHPVGNEWSRQQRDEIAQTDAYGKSPLFS